MIQSIELLRSPEYKNKLNQCIHCGLCLQACPTYQIFGTETDSPRGRIALIKAVADGRIELEDFKHGFTKHITLCLACRSCETACPSGVQYGNLVEIARIAIERNRKVSFGERFIRWLGTQVLMRDVKKLRYLARLLWLYQRSGFQSIIRKTKILPKTLTVMEDILPNIEIINTTDRKQIYIDAYRGRALFFTGCIQEAFLAPINQATVRVLNRNGYQVVIPDTQSCCGAAHLHLGDIESARQLARHNIDVFIDLLQDGDFIINNAGGCGLSLKEYPHLLKDDPNYLEKAKQFSRVVRDVTEFLANNLRKPPRGNITAKVTYADSCHLRHGQKVIREPRQLIIDIPGVEFIELQAPELCCGSAGVYNITQSQTAQVVLQSKMEDIKASGAEIVTTTNTGCYMQLLAGVRKSGSKARVMHVVELLDLSYQNEGR